MEDGDRDAIGISRVGCQGLRVLDGLAGRTVGEVERSLAPARVFVQRIRRGAALLETGPDTVFRPGDVAVVAAPRHVLLGSGSAFGEEVEDRDLLDFPMAGSKLPVLCYTVPYAIGNILLIAWGPVIVLLTR